MQIGFPGKQMLSWRLVIRMFIMVCLWERQLCNQGGGIQDWAKGEVRLYQCPNKGFSQPHGSPRAGMALWNDPELR